MKRNIIMLSLSGLMVAAAPVLGGIPLPEAVVIGRVVIDQNIITSDDKVTVVAKCDGNIVGRYQMGGSAQAGDRFVLRIPVESLADGSEPNPNAIRLGDMVEITAIQNAVCNNGENDGELCSDDDDCPNGTCGEVSETMVANRVIDQVGAIENLDPPGGCLRDCDCYFQAVEDADLAGQNASELLDVCNYHFCDNGSCNSCGRDKSGQTVSPWNASGIVTTADILCAVSGFGNYCSCPNADIWDSSAPSNKGPSGTPISTDDILAIVEQFGGPDQFGCPIVPASDANSCDSVSPPQSASALAASGPSAASPSVAAKKAPNLRERRPRPTDDRPATFELVPRNRRFTAGGLVTIDVYVQGAYSLSGVEFGVAIADREADLTLISASVDVNRDDFVFRGLQSFAATDRKRARVSAVMTGTGIDVPRSRRQYVGTFEFRAAKDASGSYRIVAQPEHVGLWQTVSQKIDVAKVNPAVIQIAAR